MDGFWKIPTFEMNDESGLELLADTEWCFPHLVDGAKYIAPKGRSDPETSGDPKVLVVHLGYGHKSFEECFKIQADDLGRAW